MDCKLFINGSWVEGASDRRIGVVNPATEEVIAEYNYASRAQVAEAFSAAQAAFDPWRKATAYERAEVLKGTAALMRERVEELARLMTFEVGKPLAESKGEIMASASYFEWAAEEGKRLYGRLVPASKAGVRRLVLKQPIGVTAALSAWNFPVLLPARKLAGALGAGCTMVSRSASQTPLACQGMIHCLADAGLPAGVVNFLVSSAGDFTSEAFGNPACRKLSFTGSTEVGKQLVKASADNLVKLSLELGGSAPVLIFPDVDVDEVAKATVAAKFRNMGQVCIAATRFYAHEAIYDDYVEACAHYASQLKIGNGLEEGVNCGPLINGEAVQSIEAFLADAVAKGATVVSGGNRPQGFEKGFFFEPTVLTNISPLARLTCEEVFGPLMPLFSFRTTEEALSLANKTTYGLASYLFTKDLGIALQVAEELEFGLVGVNDMIIATAEAPFGGMKESGQGREGAIEGLEAFLETKYVALGLKAL